MEKQAVGTVASAVGNMSFKEWLDLYFNERNFEGDQLIATKDGKKVPLRYAALLFKPVARRGQNGMGMEQFLGVVDLRAWNMTFALTGFKEDQTIFPLGVPKNSMGEFALVEHATTMIGQVWRRFRTTKPETKWLPVAVFNVLQFFLFNCSSNPKDCAEQLPFMHRIWNKLMPELVWSQCVEQMVMAQAVSWKSDDVLHTLLALHLAKKLNIRDSSTDENSLKLALIEQTLKRQLKYGGISSTGGLSAGLKCFFYDSEIILKYLNGPSADKAADVGRKIQATSDKLKESGETLNQMIIASPLGKTVPLKGLQASLSVAKKETSKGPGSFRFLQEREAPRAQFSELEPFNRIQPAQPAPVVQVGKKIHFFSDEIDVQKKGDCLASTFPIKWAMIHLDSFGTYEIELTPILGAKFYSKNTYKEEAHNVSLARFSFGRKTGGRRKLDNKSDTFSISGVHYDFAKKKYIQRRPIVPKNKQVDKLTLRVNFSRGKIVVYSLDKRHVMELSHSNGVSSLVFSGKNVKTKLKLLELDEDDLAESMVNDELPVCPICFDDVEGGEQETACAHCFHEDCLTEWTERSQNCPLCRAPIIA